MIIPLRRNENVSTSVTLKCKLQNKLTLADTKHVLKDPIKASYMAILNHQRSFGISYDQRLFDIAEGPQGHYLIYDNDKVLAYTIIR